MTNDWNDSKQLTRKHIYIFFEQIEGVCKRLTKNNQSYKRNDEDKENKSKGMDMKGKERTLKGKKLKRKRKADPE